MQGAEGERRHSGVKERVCDGYAERSCQPPAVVVAHPAFEGVHAERDSGGFLAPVSLPVLVGQAFGQTVTTGELWADPGRDAPPGRLFGSVRR